MAGGAGGSLGDSIREMGKGSNSIWDQNKDTPWYMNPWYAGGTHYTPGQGVQMGQGQPPTQAGTPQAPWMQNQGLGALGQMGQSMMARGTMPPMGGSLAHHGAPPGLMNGAQMSMPAPPMQGQPLTPQSMNQMLLNHTGLMGRNG